MSLDGTDKNYISLCDSRLPNVFKSPDDEDRKCAAISRRRDNRISTITTPVTPHGGPSDSDSLLCKTRTGASRTCMDGRLQDGWLRVIWK